MSVLKAEFNPQESNTSVKNESSSNEIVDSTPKVSPLTKFINLFNNKKLIVGLLALLLVVSGAAALYAYRSSHSSSDEIMVEEAPVHETEFISYLTSICGYEIGLPATTLRDGDVVWEWTYEEMQMGPSLFNKLAPDVVTSSGVMHSSMLFISEDKKIDEENVSFDRGAGLLSFCVNNSQDWDLDEFVQYAQNLEDDQLNVLVSDENTTWGELTLRQVNLDGVLNGSVIKSPYYLAVIGGNDDGENSRLVLFQPWVSEEEVVEADRLAMVDALKSKQMSSPIEFVVEEGSVTRSSSAEPSSPSCEQFTIYEGKFKSDKCYAQKDYNELVYYLKQYNGAIYDQNSAARGSQITCNGSDFFADECEEDKAQYEAALAKQAELEPIIFGIIERGS